MHVQCLHTCVGTLTYEIGPQLQRKWGMRGKPSRSGHVAGVKLLDLWTLLREQGKDAVRAHLDRLKFFLASFKGVFQLHISDASSEPGVLECVPFDA